MESGSYIYNFPFNLKKEFPLICFGWIRLCLQVVLYHHRQKINVFERSPYYIHACFLVGKIITLIKNLWFQFVRQLGWICHRECKPPASSISIKTYNCNKKWPYKYFISLGSVPLVLKLKHTKNIFEFDLSLCILHLLKTFFN